MVNIKRIGVFTSGGDAPGMNACIRAVVRTALYEKLSVTGIYQGYQGMLDGNFTEMTSRSVSNIIQLGGTILKTARCLEFKTKEGRAKAYENVKAAGIDALVAIGGDGTFTGADFFSKEYDIPVICIPGTIDNDLYGSDFTLGYDTATNTVIEAIDKIRDTAASHERLFFIEVMGRDSGCIALNAGIAGGAEAILLPEKETAIDELIAHLSAADGRGKKSSSIVIVAEGDQNGGAYNVAKKVKEKFDYYDTKVSILGHLQRGGSPSSFDRVLASRLGFAAVKELLKGNNRMTVGVRGNEVVTTPLEEAINNKEYKLSSDMLELVQVLAI
ncbi:MULTISPECIES: 6-phosphofructokinase [Sphingobacterium]|uniref:ATP-dependent 6-phosphofructokinase n=2 Tax=Sphingobacterium TaxID=28453 RepID=A0ABW5YVT7_9SPHI|nr:MULTISPECIES: 6-phosphofructokinase [Sphingobacterium]QQD14062.1 6-phosphofructokinase [Sphingobacterium sp. UDSM-2020]KKX49290.1 6-phosphofructokinase [Sphingobacterium sp. IITKGP-BTPF85]MBB2950016.1 6-phosphofructokinase 1 [Sphingobacterium sp. JUb56]MCS3554640.1 6-phosphofructokinase 1 [Sphingobacterium sp. JUb21]NJI73366.1 6-phosphofructokinase [Sphingobacterium sp. B16(2022)]